MRWSEIITEGRDAPLYHATSVKAALSILRAGALGNPDERLTDDGHPKVSMTRDERLRYYAGAPVQFVMDQRRLAQRYKIKPFDFFSGRERAVPRRQHLARNPGSGKWDWEHTPSSHEAEEIVYASSIPLSMCIEIILEPSQQNIPPEDYEEILRLAAERDIVVRDRRN